VVQNVLQPLAALAGTQSGTGAAATAATGATTSISAGAAAMMAALQRAQDAVPGPGIDYPLMQQPTGNGWVVAASSRLNDTSTMTSRLERLYDRPTAGKCRRTAAKGPPRQLLTRLHKQSRCVR